MKIPEEAIKVFKGKVFDVYQWPQKMFDGTESTFEMLKRANTVEIIAISEGKIFISQQSQPNKPDFFSLFGGRGEEDEEPLVTAKRELLEESGLTSESWQLYKTYEPIHKIDWTIYTFIAKDCKKVFEQKLDSGEKIETKECNFEEFIDKVLSDKYWGNEFVLDVLRMKDQGKLEDFKNRLLS